MRRLAAALVALALCGEAVASLCPGCAKEWTQVANNVQLVHIAGQEAQQVANQIRQYQWMLRHGRRLASWQKRDVMGNLRRLSRIVALGSRMADEAGDFDRRFRRIYRGYGHYAGPEDERDYAADYRRWNDTRMNAVRDAYYAADLHAEAFRDEDAAAREVERQMETAEGQMQVLQASGAIARMEVEQLQKLRQLMAVQIKLQGEVIAADAERQAADDAERERWNEELSRMGADVRAFLDEEGARR